MKTMRKGSLDEITHKNKDEILFYIPEAKIEIYSHCLICYDPSTFTDLSTANPLSDLYGSLRPGETSNQSHRTSAREGKGMNEIKWEDKIENGSPPTLAAGSTTGSIDQSQRDQRSQKVIYFNNPDISFYVDQEKGAIEIHNLGSKRPEAVFSMDSSETLSIVQSLLRKKLCELGFYRKYKILKQLGKGGTALVHLVERLSDRKNFAAKIISTLSSNEKQFELFVNEAKLLRILKHKNIIHLESVYIHKSELIQVLEYLPGGTLLEVLKKNQIRDSQAKWAVLKDITSGLEYLRQRRIVHRDLKLENLMVRTSSNCREVVISDFGLACWAGEKNPIYEKCGTPGYIAPEILNLPAKVIFVDHRSDIFSLGVIAHLLFLHEPLFHFQGSLKDLIQENKKAQFDLKSQKYLEMPAHELNFLMLTLCKDVSNRVTSDQLLGMINLMALKPNRKAPERKERKLSIESEIPVTEVEIKKETSLRKKSIKIDLESANRAKSDAKESEEISPTRKMLAANARKMVSSFWESISPSSKRERLKLKENSVEKHRKFSDFLN